MTSPKVSKPHLWLGSPAYDVFFFQLAGLACLLLVIPYRLFGPSVVIPIYGAYMLLFGLPHNYLTWASILPSTTRKSYDLEAIGTLALVALGICLLIPLSVGWSLNSWVLTFIAILAIWHAYRQHHGVCKIYDAVQAQRTGDRTIFEDRKALSLFLGLGSFAVLVWSFTHPHLEFLLSTDEKYDLVYPQVPMNVYRLYLWLTAASGVWGLKRCVWDRWRAGKFVPWPQIGLTFASVAVNSLPYLFIPIEAMPLAVAISSIFHNVEYFGFVWLFERHRSAELVARAEELQLPQRLASEGSWRQYFALALAYSVAVIAIYQTAPKSAGLVFIYFVATAHYLIDSHIWRRGNNQIVSPVVGRMAHHALPPLRRAGIGNIPIVHGLRRAISRRKATAEGA